MKGIGTRDAQLIAIVAGRERVYMQDVRAEFLKQFKKDLVKEIASETSFSYKEVATSLCLTEAEYRAHAVFEACKGAGTNDDVLIDAIVTCTTQQQIHDLKAAFKTNYKKDIESVVKGDTSGYYQKFLLAHLEGRRPDRGVDQPAVNADLDDLYRAGEGKIGTNEDAWIKLITSRSNEHCVHLNRAYIPKSKGGKHTFKEIIASETSGNLAVALQCAFTDPVEWFARRIIQATQGAGTKDALLISSLLLPSQIQVQHIVAKLKNEMKTDLIALIKKETSGNYESVLVHHVETCLKP